MLMQREHGQLDAGGSQGECSNIAPAICACTGAAVQPPPAPGSLACCSRANCAACMR